MGSLRHPVWFRKFSGSEQPNDCAVPVDRGFSISYPESDGALAEHFRELDAVKTETKGVPMSLFKDETESIEESPGAFRGRIFRELVRERQSQRRISHGNHGGRGPSKEREEIDPHRHGELHFPRNAGARGDCRRGDLPLTASSNASRCAFYRKARRRSERWRPSPRRKRTAPRNATKPVRCHFRRGIGACRFPTFRPTAFSAKWNSFWDPTCAGWLQNRLSERSENRGWMRLRDDQSVRNRLDSSLWQTPFPPGSSPHTAWSPGFPPSS